MGMVNKGAYMNTFKSRKFIITAISLLFFGVALWLGKLSENNFVDLFKWVIITYTGGNVVQKAVKTKE